MGENLDGADLNSPEDAAKRLNYALNTIAILGYKEINLFTEDSKFKGLIKSAIGKLKDRPWITTQVCKVLSLISSETIKSEFLELLKEIVLEEKYNTYSFQTYQIWLLLAKHKCGYTDLKQYAIRQIEKNDETNRPVIAAMIIYLCSVDKNYRRVILRKFGEDFANGYFQNRISSIAMRSFETSLIEPSSIHKKLDKAHDFTHKYKHKDLVFINGFEENSEAGDFIEQLYSI